MLGSERIDAVQRLTIDLKDSRNAIIADLDQALART
jgi:hypothetical protein